MKFKIFFFLLSLSSCFLVTAQTEEYEIPSVQISGVEIQPFVDSLRQRILADTIKFDRKDLRHINGRTENLKPYSMLITVDMLYNYRLDIVEGSLVKEFTDEILKSENIELISYVKKEDAPTLGGFMAKNGWIFIKLKQKVKLNFNVGGLKYRKGKKRKGGDNFLQRKEGEIMIRT